MNTLEEINLIESKRKLLIEIEYREGILRQLRYDSQREKGFIANFIRLFLKEKNQEVPNLFWKDGESYGRYLIDADKELHADIALAFEKSLDRMKEDYKNADFNYVNKFIPR